MKVRLWSFALAAVLAASACETGSDGDLQSKVRDPRPPLEALRVRDLTFVGDSLWVLAERRPGQSVLVYLVSEPETPLWGFDLPEGVSARRIAATQREIYLQTGSSEVRTWPRGEGEPRSVRLPTPDAPFAVGQLGQLWAPRWEYVGFFLQASEPGPLERPFARRPPVREESLNRSAGPWSRLRLVAVSPGDTLHVFDNRTGILHKYDTLGVRRGGSRMPLDLAEAIQAATKPRLGMSREPLATELNAGCTGELNLRLAGGAIDLARIEPVSHSWRPLDAGDLGSSTSVWTCRGRLILLDRDRGRVRIRHEVP